MLMVTPAALLRLRSETRAPATLPRFECLESRPKKLPRHRREAIVEHLAEMTREAEPTAFAIEGPGRPNSRSLSARGLETTRRGGDIARRIGVRASGAGISSRGDGLQTRLGRL
jgi:hypothetical protein